jgi:hypothetical protein
MRIDVDNRTTYFMMWCIQLFFAAPVYRLRWRALSYGELSAPVYRLRCRKKITLQQLCWRAKAFHVAAARINRINRHSFQATRFYNCYQVDVAL